MHPTKPTQRWSGWGCCSGLAPASSGSNRAGGFWPRRAGSTPSSVTAYYTCYRGAGSAGRIRFARPALPLIEGGDGCGRVETDGRGTKFADPHAASICASLHGISEPSSDDGWRRVIVNRNFLASEHWHAAVEAGLALVELFGVHAFAPLVRIEGFSVVVAISPVSLVAGGRREDHADRDRDRLPIGERNATRGRWSGSWVGCREHDQCRANLKNN